MKAKDFVEDPAYQDGPQKDTMLKDIRIFSSPSEEWEVLSYYYSPELKCLVLDIAEKR